VEGDQTTDLINLTAVLLERIGSQSMGVIRGRRLWCELGL
jgi:hypothetical protein